jgi:hypothetical protein
MIFLLSILITSLPAAFVAGDFFADLPPEQSGVMMARALVQQNAQGVRQVASGLKLSPTRHNTFVEALTLIGSRCPEQLPSAMDIVCNQEAEALGRIPTFFLRNRTKAAVPAGLRELLADRGNMRSFMRAYYAARLSTQTTDRFGQIDHRYGTLSEDDMRLSSLFSSLALGVISDLDVWESFSSAAAEVEHDCTPFRISLFKSYVRTLNAPLSEAFFEAHQDIIALCAQQPDFCKLNCKRAVFGSLIDRADLRTLADQCAQLDFYQHRISLSSNALPEAINFRLACNKCFATKTSAGHYPLVVLVKNYIENAIIAAAQPDRSGYFYYQHFQKMVSDIIDTASTHHSHIAYTQCLDIIKSLDAYAAHEIARKCLEEMTKIAQKICKTHLLKSTDSIATHAAFLNSLSGNHLIQFISMIDSSTDFFACMKALPFDHPTKTPQFVDSFWKTVKNKYEYFLSYQTMSSFSLEKKLLLYNEHDLLIDYVVRDSCMPIAAYQSFITSFISRSMRLMQDVIKHSSAHPVSKDEYQKHYIFLEKLLGLIARQEINNPLFLKRLYELNGSLITMSQVLDDQDFEQLLKPIFKIFTWAVGTYCKDLSATLSTDEETRANYRVVEEFLPRLAAVFAESLMRTDRFTFDRYRDFLRALVMDVPVTSHAISRMSSLVGYMRHVTQPFLLPGFEFVLHPCFDRSENTELDHDFIQKREELATFIESSMRPVALGMAYQQLLSILQNESYNPDMKRHAIHLLKPAFAVDVLNYACGGSLLLSRVHQQGAIEFLPDLMAAGADINARGTHQQTVLMQCVLRGNLSMAEVLIQANADLELVDDADRTIIDILLISPIAIDDKKTLIRLVLEKKPLLANRVSTEERLTPLLRFVKFVTEQAQHRQLQRSQELLQKLQEETCMVIEECTTLGCSLAAESLYQTNAADMAHMGGLPYVCSFIAQRLYATSDADQDPYLSRADALVMFNQRCELLENIDLVQALQAEFSSRYKFDHTKIRQSLVEEFIEQIMTRGHQSSVVRDIHRIVDADGQGSFATFASYREMIITQTLHMMFKRAISPDAIQEIDSLTDHLCAIVVRRSTGSHPSSVELSFDHYPVHDPVTLEGFIIQLDELHKLLLRTEKNAMHAFVQRAYQNEAALADACRSTGIGEDELSDAVALYRLGKVNLATVRYFVENAEGMPLKRFCIRTDR